MPFGNLGDMWGVSRHCNSWLNPLPRPGKQRLHKHNPWFTENRTVICVHAGVLHFKKLSRWLCSISAVFVSACPQRWVNKMLFFCFVFFIVWLKSIYSHCRADEWVSRSRLPCCGTSRSCFCERPHLNTERWEYTVIMSIVSACALSRQRIICRVACSCKHRQSYGARSYRIWCQTDYRWSRCTAVPWKSHMLGT